MDTIMAIIVPDPSVINHTMGPGISSKPPSSTREPVAGDLPTHPAPSCTGHTRPRGIMYYFYSLGWCGWGGAEGCGVGWVRGLRGGVSGVGV